MKHLLVPALALSLAVLPQTPMTARADEYRPTPLKPVEMPPGLPSDTNIFAKLAKKAMPSVVNIFTHNVVKNNYQGLRPQDPFYPFFEEFFGRQGQGYGQGAPHRRMPGPRIAPRGGEEATQPVALGSGFLIDGTGLILTNYHVIADADKVKVQFTESSDEKPTDAEVVGSDPELDIALIRAKPPKDAVPIALGDSEKLEVGEYVLAVGNPFGQGHSASHGIISAKGRLNPTSSLGSYIQTDAPINPGNSGGPLINLKGEVIGINTAIDARAQGIGFAIPVNLVKQVLPQLKSQGSVSRGYLGIMTAPLTPEIAEKIDAPRSLEAPFVAEVSPGEPAYKAGLRPYDVILSVSGKSVKNPNELIQIVTGLQAGETIPVKVLRNGKETEVKIRVGTRPVQVAARRQR